MSIGAIDRSYTPEAVVAATRAADFAVIGAGHGGQAMAGYLAVRGCSVNLFNKTPEKLEPIRFRKGISLRGQVERFGKLNLITHDIDEAVARARVIMVVIPATGHRDVARLCAPHLEDGQIVVLNPGRTGGAIEFEHTLREYGCRANVTVAEAGTFIFASRASGYGEATIFGIKKTVPLAALPADRTPLVLEALRSVFPQFVAAENVLETSLDNMGAIFHPALTLLNAARIEGTSGDFDYYHEGISPSVARVLEAMDSERVAVAAALGVRARTALEWLGRAYGARGKDLYEAVLDTEGYSGIRAPATLRHRYIFEDVPASLVPMASLGDVLGVPAPTIRNIIHLASVVHEIDYWTLGRTVDRLGLAGLSPAEIRRRVMEGGV